MGEPEKEPSLTGELPPSTAGELKGLNRQPEKAPDASFVSRDARILVVDDNDVVGKLISAILTADGYEVECRKQKDVSPTSFPSKADLIVIDALMPLPGQDVPLGVGEVLKNLKASAVTRGTPVVVVTGKTLTGKNFGEGDFLEKVVELDELLAAIPERIAKAKMQKSEGMYSESPSAPGNTSGAEGGKKMSENPELKSPEEKNNEIPAKPLIPKRWYGIWAVLLLPLLVHSLTPVNPGTENFRAILGYVFIGMIPLVALFAVYDCLRILASD
ncbi:hypothetical protein KGO95_03305 [Patescibacteria group bacterium]|nr:hypothetical protein [Patescibacteria group bacterium]